MAQSSTQKFLEVDQIREGVVVLKDKTLRAILMVSSLNFALKSDEEQSAIIYQFQNFLNSLETRFYWFTYLPLTWMTPSGCLLF